MYPLPVGIDGGLYSQLIAQYLGPALKATLKLPGWNGRRVLLVVACGEAMKGDAAVEGYKSLIKE